MNGNGIILVRGKPMNLYPKRLRRMTVDVRGVAPLPQLPTTAAPGTPEKLLIMEIREKLREQLFHPADARFVGDTRPVEWMRKMRAGSGLKSGTGLIESKYFGKVPPKKSKFFS